MTSSWSMGMFGVEDPPSENEEPPAQAMGVPRSLPASSNAGVDESRLEKLKRLGSENKRLALEDSPSKRKPNKPLCKRPANKAEKLAAAKEKKEAAAEAAQAKKAAVAQAAKEQKAAAAKAVAEAQEQQKANLSECISLGLVQGYACQGKSCLRTRMSMQVLLKAKPVKAAMPLLASFLPGRLNSIRPLWVFRTGMSMPASRRRSQWSSRRSLALQP